MKVIKEGKYFKTLECEFCAALFEIKPVDVIHCIDEYYVKCPECGLNIDLTNQKLPSIYYKR